MLYKIEEFEFHSDSLVLKKNNEVVAIRHNEAKVLALLLENTDKVLSKEDILSNVWQNKIVSEQAVFQNISHLRSLFGNKAIKTFSKRGYQWQVKVASCTGGTPQSERLNQDITRESTSIVSKAVSIRQWSTLLVVALIITFVVGINWSNNSVQANSSVAIKLAYIPMNDPQETNQLILTDNELFDYTQLAQVNAETFLTSSELEYPHLAKKHPFILSGKSRSYHEKVYLDFVLKGPHADWEGQLCAKTYEALIQELQQHLSQPFIYQFLNSPQSPEFKKSSLSLAHQKFPQDSIILSQLIDIYIETKEFDKAMALSEKLAMNANVLDDGLQLGNAMLYQSKILTRKELYQLSADKLALAINAFEAINDLANQADAWHAQSWLDHQNDDYNSVKASLLKSAKLALAASDKPRELDALTYLSIMAHKHKQTEDKYSYLRQAENKMNAYQLPIYHFAKVPFHYAIFAKTAKAKEPHLKQVLEFTKLTPDHWVSQSSREQLVKQYIEQGRLQEAKALVDAASTDNAQNSYLKTLIAKENNQLETLIFQAQRTFEQAQLAGDHHLSLNIALLLCSTPNIDINYDFYSLYIEENASPHWLETNEVKLLALSR